MFKTIVADPPWSFDDPLPGTSRGASKNYKMMNLSQIQNFQLPEIAPDAVLFLWRVSAMQQEALDVCRAWGFRPYGEMVWAKKTVHGKPWFGMGRFLRSSHESILVGMRGKPQRLRADVRSIFEAPYTRHSAKPEEFYDLIETLVDGPYLDLFARRQREGWTCIGDEIPQNIEEENVQSW